MAANSLSESLPARPGSYVLVLRAGHAARLPIGRLGVLALRPGAYLYVGSALGPGGLRGRLAHHLEPDRPTRWHIDYLRPHVALHAIWYCEDGRRREHQWAGTLASLPGAEIPLPRFGASDCRCASHLVHLEAPPGLDALRAARPRGAVGGLRVVTPRA